MNRGIDGIAIPFDPTKAKKAAIDGHEDRTGYHGWMTSFGSNAKAGAFNARTIAAANHGTGVISTSATSTSNCRLPASEVCDPVTRPNGARCNAWRWAESISRKANVTQADDTRGNVGVQSGLGALKRGAVTAEEFVTINELT